MREEGLRLVVMPRNTLSWVRCELCGRRSATIQCMVGGRIVELCPYCAIALSSLPHVECHRVDWLPLAGRRGTQRLRSGIDTSLIESFGIEKGRLAEPARGKSLRRSRRAKRSGRKRATPG